MAARRERTQSDRSAQPVRGCTSGGLGLPGGTAGEGGVVGVGGEGGPAAVEAHDLHKSFPTPGGEPIEILHGISCAMMPGRMTALVGPSGSGKSTALLCLAGLEPATSGRVSLMGRDLGGLPAARVAELYRDRVGFVFQAYNLVPYLTVRENITISDTLAGRRPDSARVRDVLAGLGLEPRANAVATTLSGGEQQMLAMGRALMSRPKLLLLDEPSMGLAPLLIKEIFSIIEDINREGTTVLLVEQNANMALSIAHRAYVMETGRITLQGAAKDLAASEDVRKAYLGG